MHRARLWSFSLGNRRRKSYMVALYYLPEPIAGHSKYRLDPRSSWSRLSGTVSASFTNRASVSSYRDSHNHYSNLGNFHPRHSHTDHYIHTHSIFGLPLLPYRPARGKSISDRSAVWSQLFGNCARQSNLGPNAHLNRTEIVYSLAGPR